MSEPTLADQLKARLQLRQQAAGESKPKGVSETDAEREKRLMDDDSTWSSYGVPSSILPSSGGSIF
jgi:hypothetical protein